MDEEMKKELDRILELTLEQTKEKYDKEADEENVENQQIVEPEPAPAVEVVEMKKRRSATSLLNMTDHYMKVHGLIDDDGAVPEAIEHGNEIVMVGNRQRVVEGDDYEIQPRNDATENPEDLVMVCSDACVCTCHNKCTDGCPVHCSKDDRQPGSSNANQNRPETAYSKQKTVEPYHADRSNDEHEEKLNLPITTRLKEAVFGFAPEAEINELKEKQGKSRDSSLVRPHDDNHEPKADITENQPDIMRDRRNISILKIDDDAEYYENDHPISFDQPSRAQPQAAQRLSVDNEIPTFSQFIANDHPATQDKDSHLSFQHNKRNPVAFAHYPEEDFTVNSHADSLNKNLMFSNLGNLSFSLVNQKMSIKKPRELTPKAREPVIKEDTNEHKEPEANNQSAPTHEDEAPKNCERLWHGVHHKYDELLEDEVLDLQGELNTLKRETAKNVVDKVGNFCPCPCSCDGCEHLDCPIANPQADASGYVDYPTSEPTDYQTNKAPQKYSEPPRHDQQTEKIPTHILLPPSNDTPQIGLVDIDDSRKMKKECHCYDFLLDESHPYYNETAPTNIAPQSTPTTGAENYRRIEQAPDQTNEPTQPTEYTERDYNDGQRPIETPQGLVDGNNKKECHCFDFLLDKNDTHRYDNQTAVKIDEHHEPKSLDGVGASDDYPKRSTRVIFQPGNEERDPEGQANLRPRDSLSIFKKRSSKKLDCVCGSNNFRIAPSEVSVARFLHDKMESFLENEGRNSESTVDEDAHHTEPRESNETSQSTSNSKKPSFDVPTTASSMVSMAQPCHLAASSEYELKQKEKFTDRQPQPGTLDKDGNLILPSDDMKDAPRSSYQSQTRQTDSAKTSFQDAFSHPRGPYIDSIRTEPEQHDEKLNLPITTKLKEAVFGFAPIAEINELKEKQGKSREASLERQKAAELDEKAETFRNASPRELKNYINSPSNQQQQSSPTPHYQEHENKEHEAPVHDDLGSLISSEHKPHDPCHTQLLDRINHNIYESPSTHNRPDVQIPTILKYKDAAFEYVPETNAMHFERRSSSEPQNDSHQTRKSDDNTEEKPCAAYQAVPSNVSVARFVRRQLVNDDPDATAPSEVDVAHFLHVQMCDNPTDHDPEPFGYKPKNAEDKYEQPAPGPQGHRDHQDGHSGTPDNNNAPPDNYHPQPGNYHGPPRSFNAPPSNYHGPPRSFNAPPSNYHGPPRSFNAPPSNYHGPPRSFNAPPSNYQDPGHNQGPNNNYAHNQPEYHEEKGKDDIPHVNFLRNFQGMQGGPGAFHQMPQHQRPMAVSSMTHMIQPGQHAALNEFELRQRDRFADAKEVQPRAFNENFHLPNVPSGEFDSAASSFIMEEHEPFVVTQQPSEHFRAYLGENSNRYRPETRQAPVDRYGEPRIQPRYENDGASIRTTESIEGRQPEKKESAIRKCMCKLKRMSKVFRKNRD